MSPIADNTILNPAAGGDTIATDDVGGVKYERVKVNFGVDGSATDVSASNPLPVALTGTQAATPITDNGGLISVDDGAGSLTVDDGGGSLTVDGTVSISGALDSELTTADLDTGAGTDTRAVVGLVRAESGGGTLVGSANPLPVTGALTDTQLRATPVPVSGGLTDTQLRATPVPVSGTVTADTELPAAAALADATANPTLPSIAALGLLFNGTTWDRVRGDIANGLDVDVTRLPAIPTGANTIGKVDQGAAAAQSAAWPTKLSNGTINADVLAAAPGSDTGQPAVAVRVVSQLGAGSGLAGTIDAAADTKTNPASAQHTQAFNSVYNGTTWDRARGDITNGLDVDVTRLPALAAGAATIGKVDQGAPAVAANGWPVKLTDGTNNPAVKAASTAAAATDPALVVAVSPNNEVGVIELPAAAALADGAANPTATTIGADQQVFNGTTWDRLHGNWRTTTGDTGAKTVTFNGATQTNYDSVGAYITVQCGTVSGTTPLMGAQLQFSYDAGTTWLSFGTASPNVNTTGQTILLMVGPTNWSQTPGSAPTVLATGATSVLAMNMYLPRTWRLVYTISGTTPSFTITAVHVNYIMA